MVEMKEVSNSRPSHCERDALPAELHPRIMVAWSNLDPLCARRYHTEHPNSFPPKTETRPAENCSAATQDTNRIVAVCRSTIASRCLQAAQRRQRLRACTRFRWALPNSDRHAATTRWSSSTTRPATVSTRSRHSACNRGRTCSCSTMAAGTGAFTCPPMCDATPSACRMTPLTARGAWNPSSVSSRVQYRGAGEPLYDKSGQPLAHWTVLERLIFECETDLARSDELCKLLEEMELLEPFTMKAEVDGFTMQLEGMHRVARDNSSPCMRTAWPVVRSRHDGQDLRAPAVAG